MLQVITDKQCLKCLAINEYKKYTEDNKDIIECLKCGHKKIISVLTTTVNKYQLVDGSTSIFYMDEIPKIEYY